MTELVKFYVGDPAAPKPTRPAHLGVNALVICGEKLMLEQRWDCGRWGLPGGGARRGESFPRAIVRELYEETGLRIRESQLQPLKFYDSPPRIAAYRDGSVWRMYVKLFALRLDAVPEIHTSRESRQIRFFSAEELETLDIVQTHREMIQDYLALLKQPSAETALAFLQQDSLLNMDMIEPIRRGHAQLLYADRHGVLLREQHSGVPMLSTDSEHTAQLLLPMLGRPDIIVVHQAFEQALVKARFGLSEENPCYQVVYPDTGTLPVWGDVRRLDESYLQQVLQHYKLISDPLEMQEHLQRGEIWGQFIDGALAAFIGTHREGAIGMLEVFEPYRRHGIGQNLIHHMVNFWHAQGATAFAQIVWNNQKSLNLQDKCGAARSEHLLYWMWRE